MNDFDEWDADDWLNTYHHQFEDDDRYDDYPSEFNNQFDQQQ